jgi:ubiquinone/menaquinone biosynthesis C-methylase UbiE
LHNFSNIIHQIKNKTVLFEKGYFMQAIKNNKANTQTIDDVISSYDTQAETYDAIETEAFYINQYAVYNKHLTSLKHYIKGNVLDLGCGTGLQIPFLMKHANNVTGIDITYSLLEKAIEKFKDNPKISLLQCDATNLPFPDSYFDFISSYGEVISHIDDYEKAFAEMKRVIKPGGTIAFSVLNKWNMHVFYHPRELKDAILSKNVGQRRKWELLLESGEMVSLRLKTFAFKELKKLLKENSFEPLSFMGAHVIPLIIPLKLQYGKINFWGKLYSILAKIDYRINAIFPFYKFGYHILVGARCIK